MLSKPLLGRQPGINGLKALFCISALDCLRNNVRSAQREIPPPERTTNWKGVLIASGLFSVSIPRFRAVFKEAHLMEDLSLVV